MGEPSTFIKLDRNILEWRWYQDANTYRVFTHLLLKANIKDKDFENITVHRGELATSYPSLSTALGLSVQNVRTAIEHLKKTGEVTVKSYAKFSVISIKNYNLYQGTNSQLTGKSQPTNSQLTGYQQATNNNQRMEESKNGRMEESQSVAPEQNPEKTDTVESSVENRLTDGLQNENQNAFSKPMAFGVLLYNMGSPLYQDGYSTEQELSAFDMEDREVTQCRIPDSFKHNLQTMETALKYLAGYSNLKEGEFKEFANAVITCLGETVCTGMLSYSTVAHPDRIIDQLNEINQSVSFGVWIEDLSRKYSRILEQKAASGETIRNKHGFLKTCAVNYLTEYRTDEFYPGFKS